MLTGVLKESDLILPANDRLFGSHVIRFPPTRAVVDDNYAVCGLTDYSENILLENQSSMFAPPDSRED